MDPVKTGGLIRQLRTAKNLTQKQLAERLHVSDKAVSKWERGNGCPDLSLLPLLADVFGTDIRVLLAGEISRNESEKGDMKKLKFYICKDCGNIITATSEAAVTCCGNLLSAAEPRKAEPAEQLQVEECDGAWFVSSDHPMTKAHYISFVALVTDSGLTVSRQYPEWNLQCSLPMFRYGRIVWYCTQCGLMYQDLSGQCPPPLI